MDDATAPALRNTNGTPARDAHGNNVFENTFATFVALTQATLSERINDDDIADTVARIFDAANFEHVPNVLRGIVAALQQDSLVLLRCELHAFRAINRAASVNDRKSSELFLVR